ncbi:MAG: threonylcarbamoyl-AMP synthase [Deltaproteobacteria bacterium]|nr:threonylcarbamoyl-AMP synthase [Deltaproteobacteria bacterium]
MITLNFPFSREQLSKNLNIIINVCQRGGIIIYPTETFYAIGGNALDRKLGERLSEIKKRPPDKPFPCLAGSRKALNLLVSDWPEKALLLADRYWPGALTLVLNGYRDLPRAILGEDGSVAVRWSPHPLLNELAKLTDLPLISTSANLSGQPAAVKAEELDPQLLAAASLLIIADNQNSDLRPSTIIDARIDPPLLLRLGAVVVKEIQASNP